MRQMSRWCAVLDCQRLDSLRLLPYFWTEMVCVPECAEHNGVLVGMDRDVMSEACGALP